jgi:translation initiation factor IF-3
VNKPEATKGRYSRPEKKESHPINMDIRAINIRVVSSEVGKTTSQVRRFEEVWREVQMEGENDIIQVAEAPDGIPVCKIMPYDKFLFNLQKEEHVKQKAQREAAKRQDFKEVQLSLRIGEQDLKIKLGQASEFLEDGRPVKVALRFKGREMTHQNLGADLFAQVERELLIKAISEPVKKEGKMWNQVWRPKK